MAIVSSRHLSVEIWVLKNYEKKEWALDHKIDNKMFFVRSLRSIETCGEWEYGIFLTDEYKSMRYILPGTFTRRSQSNVKLSIRSYTKSLISLETYGNLVERRVCGETAKTKTWRTE